MLGPGKAIDTDDWFVICVNTLGSCKGSTGPASIDPATQAPYACSSRTCSIEDCAKAAKAVLNHLEHRVPRLPDRQFDGRHDRAGLPAAVPAVSSKTISTCPAARRRCLSRSPSARCSAKRSGWIREWNHGNYAGQSYPRNGMRIARKLGVVTYRSAMEWDGRFGRVRLENELRAQMNPSGWNSRWKAIWRRTPNASCDQFDPNCYLYLSRAMDWFDFCRVLQQGHR